MNTLNDLLKIYPSHYSLANDLEISPDRVYRWFKRKRIPQEKWKAVIDSATARGFIVTADQMLKMNEPRSLKMGWPKGKTRTPR